MTSERALSDLRANYFNLRFGISASDQLKLCKSLSLSSSALTFKHMALIAGQGRRVWSFNYGKKTSPAEERQRGTERDCDVARH
jgi:hypothetical protein